MCRSGGNSMWRTLLLALMALTISVTVQSPARAQDTPLEDRTALCPVVPAALIPKIVGEVIGKGQCTVACKGCGCKGGPGYRHGRDCVGWKDLVKKCGPPPHTGCTRECTPVRAGCTGRAWVKTLAASLGHNLVFQPPNEHEGRPASDAPSR